MNDWDCGSASGLGMSNACRPERRTCCSPRRNRWMSCSAVRIVRCRCSCGGCRCSSSMRCTSSWVDIVAAIWRISYNGSNDATGSAYKKLPCRPPSPSRRRFERLLGCGQMLSICAAACSVRSSHAWCACNGSTTSSWLSSTILSNALGIANCCCLPTVVAAVTACLPCSPSMGTCASRRICTTATSNRASARRWSGSSSAVPRPCALPPVPWNSASTLAMWTA